MQLTKLNQPRNDVDGYSDALDDRDSIIADFARGVVRCTIETLGDCVGRVLMEHGVQVEDTSCNAEGEMNGNPGPKDHN